MLLSTVPQQYLDIAPPGVKSRKRSGKPDIVFLIYLKKFFLKVKKHVTLQMYDEF